MADAPNDFDQRTPEERAADEKRLEDAIERLKEKDRRNGGPPAPPRRRPNTEPVDLASTLAGAMERAQQADAERKTLPCWPGVEKQEDEEGVDACEAVRAHEACRWVNSTDLCPRMRGEQLYDTILKNFAAPPEEYRVERLFQEVILAHVRRRSRVPMLKMDSLRAVAALLERKRVCVPLENGAEVRTNDRDEPVRIPNKLYLVGNEVLIVLGGNRGRGKTLAVSYAIARKGGIYTRAPQWMRRGGIDIAEALAAPVLVIDQFGREHHGESRWAMSEMEDVIDRRSQSLTKWTFLVGNIHYEAFAARLKETTITDRLLGYGVYVEFGGKSIRSGLRAEALKGSGEG
jgi:hypothetical protein